MKTTIELPDALAAQARELAHEQGVTLRELVVEGLRGELERRAAGRPRVDFAFPAFGGDGLRPGVDWSDVVELSYEDAR